MTDSPWRDVDKRPLQSLSQQHLSNRVCVYFFVNTHYDCTSNCVFFNLFFLSQVYKTQLLKCDKHTVIFSVFFRVLCPKPTSSLKSLARYLESLRPSLTALLGVNYLQIHHVLNAVPRSALLGWRKAISHQEIINQEHFDLLPTIDGAFSTSCFSSMYEQEIVSSLFVSPFIPECVCLRVVVCTHWTVSVWVAVHFLVCDR